MPPSITTLFLDIGGVLLTNGWDRHARIHAAETFHIDFGEMDERHHLTYDIYEAGKLSLEDYLNRIVFYEERSFSMEEFRTFMFSRSQPYNEMIDLVRVLKAHHHLKTVAVSNEGRELTRYRIQQFKLQEVIDSFVSSCFVHFRKPDADIFRLALDVAQVSIEHVLYIDDRSMFVQVAEDLGIRSFRHVNYNSTVAKLASLGLKVD